MMTPQNCAKNFVKLLLIPIGIGMLSAFYVENSTAQTVKSARVDYQSDINISNDLRCYDIDASADSCAEYVNYCQLVREKIKENLKTKYGYHQDSGDVVLSFMLHPDGSLIDFDIDSAKSTKNQELIGIATRGLKKSSPFPPFPESLEHRPMPFSITISFKKK